MISLKGKHQLLMLGLVIACNIPTVSAASRAEACVGYATKATGQFQQNQYAQCGYKGLRWSNDFAGQKNWCMTVRPAIANKENTVREQLLTACYERKADVENNKRPLALPGACRWNREKFKPVRYIFSRHAYNQPPSATTVIPGGLIQWDFNQDRKNDYIFVERSPAHKFRSIICVSSATGWKRQQLSTVTEDVTSHFSSEGDFIYFEKGKLSIGRSHHEHNWGTDSSTSVYSYSMRHKALLLEAVVSESSSGDGMREDTKTVWDYVKGEIRNTVKCGGGMASMGIPCTPKNNVVTKMKPANYAVAKRKFRGF